MDAMTHFNVIRVVLVLRASLNALPPSDPILLSLRLESEQLNVCHMTHSNVVSVLWVLRASPSARPPSDPKLLPFRLMRVVSKSRLAN